MDEDMRTVWCGNLSDKVTEELLYELFLQGGPIQRVTIPKDRDGKQKPYGFVTYKHFDSVLYALQLFDGTSLFNRTLNMSPRRKINVSQINCLQNYSYNFNDWLQLGQEMSLTNDISHLKGGMFELNMVPNINSHMKQIDNYSYKDDRRSRRVHPYNRKQSESNNHHKEHSSRSHNNHKTNDYFRHDHKNNRRNYH